MPRPASSTAASAPAVSAARLERRRRQQHLRLRRRDLLEDFAIAIALTIIALIWTAGLGVLALVEIPVAATVIGSFVLERRSRKRRTDRVRRNA